MKTKQQKRLEANERREAWQAKTPQEQLAILDDKCLLATKQRKRIQKQINSMEEKKK